LKWSQVPEPARGLKVNRFLGSFAATESGLFRSLPGARSWTLVDPIGVEKVQVLAPLGKSALAAATASKIFVSENGLEWKTTAPLPVQGTVYNISAAGDRSLIAGTSSGLIRSDDLGASWEPVTWGLGPSSVSAVCQHPLRPRTVFAAQFGVVYQSDDAGNNWRAISPAHHSSAVQIEVITALAVLPGSPDRLMALTQSQGTFALQLSNPAESTTKSASISGKTDLGKSSQSNSGLDHTEKINTVR
jgi:hypothetical protein